MIAINGVQKSFGDLKVLEDINLQIEDGDIYGLVGKSGAGKSTLLRCLNGQMCIRDRAWPAASRFAAAWLS